MSFFQNSVLNKYLKTQNTGVVQLAYKKFTTYFHNPEIQNNIREAKEEQFQEGFLRELFVNIFGYTINPDPNFNLTTEFKNLTGSKKADGAILIDGKALAVIELKGTDTRHLDKINEQAFNYKNNQTDCIYVITSNFEKLRFYIHNSVDHLEFNLFTITEKEFQILWLCIASECLLKGVPARVKEESSLVEENITKYLYKDYANFRNDLWQNMVLNNPQADQLTLFKKTQKLLDRFLFVYFAEDGGLLPPNSITRMVERWQVLKDEDAYKPLYDIFRQFFGYINTGRKGKTENDDIFAFNGGLFLPDEILDTIRIDDEVLRKHTMKLSTYDFLSEVDVNILGHIFESSLNEIENVKAQIEGQETDKSKSKRKKDGIFYTPRYITKYIVENTVGKLCEEKKAELNIIDEEYAKGRRNRKKEILHKLDDQLKAYREWLFNITICDPACGSGAFLNQALEFLIEEHRYIDELQAQLLGSSFIFPDVENHILEKNIFGVDINDESVEIARLSLWLRTAQRGRKLTTLNSNIKCGNSLIDDPSVAGDKAFNWQKEFPGVFRIKEKKAWHVVFCLHNSRYSKCTNGLTRRWEYMPGLLGHTHPELTPKEEEILAECLAIAAKEKNLNITECNICVDHVHAIIVCEQEELENNMRLWKGRSAYIYNRCVNPSVALRQYDENYQRDYSDGTIQKFWAKSYHATLIESQEQMFNTVQYIRTNREKHGLQSSTDGVPYSTDGVPYSTDGVPYSTDGLTRQLNPKTLPSETDGGTHATEGGTPATDGLTRQLNTKAVPSITDGLTRQLQSLVCTTEQAFRTEYKGGFDVVIGNPPYGAKIEKVELDHVILNYNDFGISTSLSDTYFSFYALSLKKLLKQDGYLGFITPNTWRLIESAKNFRNTISNKSFCLSQIIQHLEKVFADATVDCDTLIIKKANTLSEILISITNINGIVKQHTLNQITLSNQESFNLFLTSKDYELKEKINQTSTLIKDIFIIKNGVKPYEKGKGKPPQTEITMVEKPFTSEIKKDESFSPLIGGSSFHKYKLLWENDYWIQYGEWLAAPRDKEIFEAPEKLIFRQTSDSIISSLVGNGFIIRDNTHILLNKTNSTYDLKYVLALMNSKFTDWYYWTINPEKGEAMAQVKAFHLGMLPFKEIACESQKPFIEKADLMLSLNKELQALTNKFSTYFSGQYKLDKLSNKLESWYELEFPAFITELNKAIKTAKGTRLTKKDEFEWIDLFNENKQKALALKNEIEKTDKEIDRMVYELYGLTEEEIKIVEGK